jgi:hypothetical protein
VDVYFRPADVDESKDNDTPAEYLAATLRGRGLLAKKNDITVDGRLLKVDKNELKEIARFGTLTEWQHEHQTAAVQGKESRLKNAMDWMQTASVLHAPLPVPEE